MNRSYLLSAAIYIHSASPYKHYNFFILSDFLTLFPHCELFAAVGGSSPPAEGLLETFIPPKIKLRGREVCEALPPQQAPSL